MTVAAISHLIEALCNTFFLNSIVLITSLFDIYLFFTLVTSMHLSFLSVLAILSYSKLNFCQFYYILIFFFLVYLLIYILFNKYGIFGISKILLYLKYINSCLFIFSKSRIYYLCRNYICPFVVLIYVERMTFSIFSSRFQILYFYS